MEFKTIDNQQNEQKKLLLMKKGTKDPSDVLLELILTRKWNVIKYAIENKNSHFQWNDGKYSINSIKNIINDKLSLVGFLPITYFIIIERCTNVENLQSFMFLRPNVNVIDPVENKTPLSVIISHTNQLSEIFVGVLLSVGADPNFIEPGNTTPFLRSIHNQNICAARQIILCQHIKNTKKKQIIVNSNNDDVYMPDSDKDSYDENYIDDSDNDSDNGPDENSDDNNSSKGKDVNDKNQFENDQLNPFKIAQSISFSLKFDENAIIHQIMNYMVNPQLLIVDQQYIPYYK